MQEEQARQEAASKSASLGGGGGGEDAMEVDSASHPSQTQSAIPTSGNEEEDMLARALAMSMQEVSYSNPGRSFNFSIVDSGRYGVHKF